MRAGSGCGFGFGLQVQVWVAGSCSGRWYRHTAVLFECVSQFDVSVWHFHVDHVTLTKIKNWIELHAVASFTLQNKVRLVAASAIMPTIEADNGHRGSFCRMLADWCRLVLGGMLQNDGLFGQNAADLVQAYS